jgi:hypothetical protein
MLAQVHTLRGAFFVRFRPGATPGAQDIAERKARGAAEPRFQKDGCVMNQAATPPPTINDATNTTHTISRIKRPSAVSGHRRACWLL